MRFVSFVTALVTAPEWRIKPSSFEPLRLENGQRKFETRLSFPHPRSVAKCRDASQSQGKAQSRSPVTSVTAQLIAQRTDAGQGAVGSSTQVLADQWVKLLSP